MLKKLYFGIKKKIVLKTLKKELMNEKLIEVFCVVDEAKLVNFSG